MAAAMVDAMVEPENVEPFGRIRREVATFYDAFVEKTSVHFVWLDEVLEEAKRVLQKPEVELIPKTPSEKRKRGRPKNGSIHKRQSSTQKRQSSIRRTPRQSQAYRKATLAILECGGDTGAESESQLADSEETDTLENVVLPMPIFPTAIVEEAAEDAVGEQVVIQDRDTGKSVEGASHHDAQDVQLSKDVVPKEDRSEESVPQKLVVAVEAEKKRPPALVLVAEEEQQMVNKTPDPPVRKAVPPKSYLPIPTSAKEKFSTPSTTPLGTTPRTTPGPSINRCHTPQKSAVKPSTEEARDKFHQQMAGATAKREELLKQKIDEQKRRREERALKVAQQRMVQKAKDEEFKRKIEEKYQTPVTADMDEKRKLRPRYPDSSAKKTDDSNDRALTVEKEKAKEKERILREQEELQRLKEVEQECRQVNAPPPMAQCASIQVEPKAEATQQQSTKPKNEVAPFHPPHDTSVAKIVTKPKISRETFVVPSSGGASANTSDAVESYEMTPLRKVKPATATDYDISDLRSSDETDDEEHPRKKIPSWAQGGQMKMALTQQYYNPPDLNELFGVVQMPDLTQMFTIQRKRFLKRTSSAKWDSPIRPHIQK